MNSFRAAGVNFNATHREKVVLSTLYKVVSEQSPPEEVPPELKPSEAALEALEKGMDVETKERFAVRFERGYV